VPRKAGTSDTYSWVLLDKSTGKPTSAAPINLPSVTTIVKKVLAKEALLDWNYRETRDRISGLAGVLREELLWSDARIVDLLGDADMLEDFLRNNKLRPRDTTDEAAEKGSKEHEFLERLCAVNMNDGPDASFVEAARALEDRRINPHKVSIASWFMHRRPVVVAAEETVYSLKHGFAGTMDVAWHKSDSRYDSSYIRLTDLKNRKVGAEAYASDHYQLDGYGIAWDEMNPGAEYMDRSVLVARADGTWIEEDVHLKPEAFLSLLQTYNDMKEAHIA
jgi:hypothetical protein